MTPATVSEANLETMAAAGTKIAAAGIPVITGRIMARITLYTMATGMAKMLRKRFPTTAVLGKPRKILCEEIYSPLASAMIEKTSKGALSTVMPRMWPNTTFLVKPSSSTTDRPVYIRESLMRDQLISCLQSIRAPFWNPPPGDNRLDNIPNTRNAETKLKHRTKQGPTSSV